MKDWSVYILQCVDGTYYTGITTDLSQRVLQHNAGTGAKYTRGRGPVKVVWEQTGFTRSEALKEEVRIKKLSRGQKESLFL